MKNLITLQVLQSITLNLESEPTITSTKEDTFLNKIVIIIEQNIENSKLGVEYICKEMWFSKSQLYRKMKGVIGQSTNEFIRSIRLRHAAQLLKECNLNISEITYKVGFNDLQYFRQCFKKQYGMTPSKYKEKKGFDHLGDRDIRQ